MNTILKYITLLCSLPILFGGLASCTEEDDSSTTYANWPARNTGAFHKILTQAKADIAAGDTKWRIIKSYATTNELCDTNCIVVRIDVEGTGAGCPLYTDSVRVNYQGRLINPDDLTEGKQFDHSGYYNDYASIFSPALCRPATFRVSNTVEGFTTALQHMHIGDRWHVYMPYQMGYGKKTTSSIPGGSLLVFDIELMQYARTGVALPEWK